MRAETRFARMMKGSLFLVAIVAPAMLAACSGTDDVEVKRAASEQQPPSATNDPAASTRAESEPSKADDLRRVGGTSAPPSSDLPGGESAPTTPSTPSWFAPGYGWGPGLALAAPAPNALWPSWGFVGQLGYAGFAQGFTLTTGGAIATHVFIDAPATCAPVLSGAAARVFPNGTLVPLWNVGQRTVNGVIQALLLVGNGLATSLGTIELAFKSAAALTCPINVYVVKS